MIGREPKPGTVGVIGLGTMGQGITKTLVLNGVEVLVADVDHATGQSMLERISKDFALRLEKKKITYDEMELMLSRIRLIRDISELSEVNIVFEAVSEDIQAKCAVFRQVEGIVNDDVLIATNTSSLSVSELSLFLRKRDRFAGAHFFNPAERMSLVEIVQGTETSTATVLALCGFMGQLGKTPVIVCDIPGFCVNRILFPMVVEGIRVLEMTSMTPGEIDKAMKLGANLPLGPLELSDLIGNDVTLSICTSLFERTGDSKFEPPHLLSKIVDEGRLGRKTGQGFYSYP